jgi:hypothetical protein
MSRRTKLLITALFLVLLAIPIAYVALTWTVKKPLRVRYVGLGEPEMSLLSPFNSRRTLLVPVQLELENTAFAPIYISQVTLDLDGTRGLADPLQVFAGDEPLSPGPIPVGGFMRGQALVTPETARSIQVSEMQLHYEWVTTTNMRVREWLMKAGDHYHSDTLYDMSVSPLQSDLIPVENASTTPP